MLNRYEYDRCFETDAVKVGEWILCGACGKKLEKVISDDYNIQGVERKCPNCKSINAINLKGGK